MVKETLVAIGGNRYNVYIDLRNVSRLDNDQLPRGGEFYYADPKQVSSEDFESVGLSDHPTVRRIGGNTLTLVQDQVMDGRERQLPSSSELYAGILDSSMFPSMESRTDDRPVIVKIASDHSLHIGSSRIKLGTRQVFFFNSLMLLRDAPRSAEEYVELGFEASRGVNDLNSSAKLFVERVNEAAGTQLITHLEDNSGERKYTVSSSLQIEDTRNSKAVQQAKEVQEKKKPGVNLKSFLKPGVQLEPVVFETLRDRSDVLKVITQQYKDHPRVNELLTITRKPAQKELPTTAKGHRLASPDRHRLISHEEVVDLFKCIENGLSVHQKLGGKKPNSKEVTSLAELTAAYSVVYASNLGLVWKLTSKIIPEAYDPYFEDLFQEGTIGLGEAIRRFDHRKGYTFSTYATDWIKNGLHRGYDATARAIRLPAEQSGSWVAYKRRFDEMRAELGHSPSIDEMVKETGLSQELIVDLNNYGPRNLPSLDAPINSEDDRKLGEILSQFDEKDVDSSDRTYRPALHPEIEKIFIAANVSPTRQLALSLRYGVFVRSLEGTPLSYQDSDFTYEEFMDALHAEGGELSDAEVAGILRVREDTLRDGINRTLRKIQGSVDVRALKFNTLAIRS